MGCSHNAVPVANRLSAIERLEVFLARHRSRSGPEEDFSQFEEEARAVFAEAEAEVVGEELSRWDVSAPVVVIDGRAHRHVLRHEDTYFTTAGPARVTRNLYSARGHGERAVCPMELRAGVVEGRWTPGAAKLASWVVAHETPKEAEELFRRLGRMAPSKSSLDRLPKRLNETWEGHRVEFEMKVREEEPVPQEAATIAISLDGVMVPMKDGERKAKREAATAKEKYARGPAGHREVGCGTVSLYDKDGERLRTVRWGRMPQKKKATLKAILTVEAMTTLLASPHLTIVKVADGARDNWDYLTSDDLPSGIEVVDYYHAAEHLTDAFKAAYGDTSSKAKAQAHKYRHVLLEEADGVEKVIRALRHLRDTYPRRKKLRQELTYFRRNRARMQYAALVSRGLPISSGVTEAACKTLATQRMKRSGMRWGEDGGQAVLTLRSLVQSNRFDRGWELIAATYKKEVTTPPNVVAMRAWQ